MMRLRQLTKWPLISGGSTTDKAKQLKREAIEIFNDAKFELHKWHSNKEELETDCENYERSFAKEQLKNVSKPEGIKVLGVSWGKVQARTHDPEPTAPILGLCNGIFTDRSIFRLSFLEKKQRQFRFGDPMTSA